MPVLWHRQDVRLYTQTGLAPAFLPSFRRIKALETRAFLRVLKYFDTSKKNMTENLFLII